MVPLLTQVEAHDSLHARPGRQLEAVVRTCIARARLVRRQPAGAAHGRERGAQLERQTLRMRGRLHLSGDGDGGDDLAPAIDVAGRADGRHGRGPRAESRACGRGEGGEGGVVDFVVGAEGAGEGLADVGKAEARGERQEWGDGEGVVGGGWVG